MRRRLGWVGPAIRVSERCAQSIFFGVSVSIAIRVYTEIIHPCVHGNKICNPCLHGGIFRIRVCTEDFFAVSARRNFLHPCLHGGIFCRVCTEDFSHPCLHGKRFHRVCTGLIFARYRLKLPGKNQNYGCCTMHTVHTVQADPITTTAVTENKQMLHELPTAVSSFGRAVGDVHPS